MSSRPSPKPPPLLLRGSIISLRRRCGKNQCRCAAGQPHETPALSYSLQGRTHIQTLSPDLLPHVRKALTRYRQAVAQLDRQTERTIAWLRQQMGHAKLAIGRRKP